MKEKCIIIINRNSSLCLLEPIYFRASSAKSQLLIFRVRGESQEGEYINGKNKCNDIK